MYTCLWVVTGYMVVYYKYFTCTCTYDTTITHVYTTNITHVYTYMYMYMYAFFIHSSIIKGSFHNSLCLRYSWPILKMPQMCSCGKIDVSYAVIHVCS